MRNIKFENGEYYHVYNRGVDKRNIFGDKNDIWRFIKGILIFNRLKVVGSIRDELDENHRGRDSVPALNIDYGKLIEMSGGLVEIVAICLNPNHFHLLVSQISDNGVSKFMHKLGSGYNTYFNIKNERSGSLFQGKFKAVYVKSNEQLLYLSAYINKNDKIHEIGKDDEELVFSSCGEYYGKNKVLNMCKGKGVILDQFEDFVDYKDFMEDVMESAKKLKKENKEENKEENEECLE